MSLRTEFVRLAQGEDSNIAELARRFGISRPTAYKWLARDAAGEALQDRSRRPALSPRQTASALELQVVALRRRHPHWGGRKLAQVLRNQGHGEVPAPSTITHILRRHGLLGIGTQAPAPTFRRFEHAAPNDLWQMDFKGPIRVGTGRCDPFSALDDHSRFNLLLRADPDMRGATVQASLTTAFRRYGLPLRMNMDNGSPWGIGFGESRQLSTLTVWLVQLGIHVSFSAPYHPQTNGKQERFHRSLDIEVLRGRAFADLAQTQAAFDQWRSVYNTLRPHEALGMQVPVSRYRPSPRPFPEVLPPIEYAPQDHLLTVRARGRIRFKGHPLTVSTALCGHTIAARPRDAEDGVFDLYFAHHRLRTLDLRHPLRV